MDTRQVLLVDAFATEPLGGVPVAVLPGETDLSTARRGRVRAEFDAAGLVTTTEDGLRAGRATRDPVAAAVAGGAGLVECDEVETGTHTLQTTDDSFALTVDADRSVRVDLPEQPGESVSVSSERIAEALGIDPAVMDDVRADLPVGRCTAGGTTLLVPVNFLEHLGNADPTRRSLAALLEAVGATRLCAFTFDTLGRDADVHARVFDPAAQGCERATSGHALAACGAHLSRHPVFDADRESVRVECGRFVNRPGTAVVTLADAPTVTGAALTSLDGTVTLPSEDDDEILEA